jgi:hypothetical protein
MGLTIHYTIRPKRGWKEETIRAKLEEVRQKAMDLPFEWVSPEIMEFSGDNAKFYCQPDDFEDRWFLVQACRSSSSPWKPGLSRSQAPAHVIGFTVEPGDGCEPCNFGFCEYEPDQWPKTPLMVNEDAKTRFEEFPYVPHWENAFDGDKWMFGDESRKIILDFCAKYDLEFVPQWIEHRRKHAPRTWVSIPLGSSRGFAWREAAYVGSSSLPGSDTVRAVVAICDNYNWSEIGFAYRGPTADFRPIAESPEFKRDLKRILTGKNHTVKADKYWDSFCKTHYADDPEYGGIENFLRCHLNVVALLDKLMEIGFNVEVRDEGEYWETRDVERLLGNLKECSEAIAAFVGVLKDLWGNQVSAPILNRNDFEHIEAAGQDKISPELLRLIEETRKSEDRRDAPAQAVSREDDHNDPNTHFTFS